MKTFALKSALASALLIPLTVWFLGCATPGYRTGEKTAATLESLAGRIERAGLQMDIAVTELNRMINDPQPDLRPQFQRFAAAVDNLSSLSNRVSKADERLEERGEQHFETWNAELAAIQNEAIRSSGLARKLEVQSRFDAIRGQCLEVLTRFTPVQSDLNDLEHFLSADLNPKGLAAIRDSAGRVIDRATPVRESISKLVADMRTLARDVSPQTGAAAPAETASSK